MDMYFGVYALVVGILNEDHGEGDLIKDGEHCGGRVGEKVGKDRFG